MHSSALAIQIQRSAHASAFDESPSNSRIIRNTQSSKLLVTVVRLKVLGLEAKSLVRTHVYQQQQQHRWRWRWRRWRRPRRPSVDAYDRRRTIGSANYLKVRSAVKGFCQTSTELLAQPSDHPRLRTDIGRRSVELRRFPAVCLQLDARTCQGPTEAELALIDGRD
jgi:hypothetical protein